MNKKVRINENFIKKVVSESIKKYLKEDNENKIKNIVSSVNDIKVTNVFFKLLELTDKVGFTPENWDELIKKCERQKMMRSFPK